MSWRGLFPLAVLLAMGIAWGLQFAMLKLAVAGGYPALNVLALALWLISLVYAVLTLLRRRWFSLDAARLRFFLVVAVLGYLLPMGATLAAAPYMAAGMLTLLASLAPLFTFAVALLLRTERVSPARIWAMLLGCLATGLVLVPELSLPGYGLLPWLAVALLIPFCYGVESIYVAARWPPGLDVLQVALGEALVAAVLMLPLLAVFGEPASLLRRDPAAEFAVVVFVFCGVFEVFMYFYLVRTTGGVLVSFATFVSLFAGIGWGMLIFAESHPATTWLAVAVLVGALALVAFDSLQNTRGRDLRAP